MSQKEQGDMIYGTGRKKSDEIHESKQWQRRKMRKSPGNCAEGRTKTLLGRV